MFTLTPNAFRSIRVDDLGLTESQLAAKLYRVGGGVAHILAYEAGERRPPLSITLAMIGFRDAARAARGHARLRLVETFPA